MADYYWVGGAGVWDYADTTHWATSSGGPGGFGPPTGADNAIIDNSSHVGAAFSIDVGNYPNIQNLTISISSFVLTFINGGISLNGFSSATNGVLSVSSPNADLSQCSFAFFGDFGQFQCNRPVGGLVINTNTQMTLTYPTITVNGGFGINTNQLVCGPGTTVTASNINFNGIGSFLSSTLFIMISTYYLSINNTPPGTWTGGPFICTGASNGSAVVTVQSGVGAVSVQINGGCSSVDINGIQNTQTSLTFAQKSADGYTDVALGTDLTLTAINVQAGNTNAARRIYFHSNSPGTQRTITSLANLYDADFQDIAFNATRSGTRVGNLGGNSNITFDAPRTVYWVTAAGGTYSTSTSAWSSTAGGAGSTTYFPIPQDIGTIVDTGLNAGASISFNSSYYVPTINAASRTLNCTLNFIGGSKLKGSLLASATSNVTGSILFSGRGVTQNLAMLSSNNSASLTMNDSISNPNVSLVGIANTTGTFTLQTGTLSLNSYDFSLSSMDASSDTYNRTLNLGTGSLSIYSVGTGTPFNMGTTPTKLTITNTSSTIKLINSTNSASITFAGGGKTYGTLSLNGGSATSQTFNVTGTNTFTNINSNKTNAYTVKFEAAKTHTFANWSLTGSAGNILTIGSITNATHTLAKSGGGTVSVPYASISYSTATPTNTWIAPGGTNGGNNTGWSFAALSLSSGNFMMLFQ